MSDPYQGLTLSRIHDVRFAVGREGASNDVVRRAIWRGPGNRVIELVRRCGVEFEKNASSIDMSPIGDGLDCEISAAYRLHREMRRLDDGR